MKKEDIMRDFVRRVEATRKPVDIVLSNGRILRNIGSVEYHPKRDDMVILYLCPADYQNGKVVRCDQIKEIR